MKCSSIPIVHDAHGILDHLDSFNVGQIRFPSIAHQRSGNHGAITGSNNWVVVSRSQFVNESQESKFI